MRNLRSQLTQVFLLVLVLTLAISSSYSINSSAASGTVVKGTLKGTVVWSPDKSPYIITSNLIIYGTLIIEPGVEVYVCNHVIIKIKGELIVNGTEEKPVIIKSFNASSTRWYFSIYRSGTLIVRNAVMDRIKWWVMDGAYVVLKNVVVSNEFEAKYPSNSYISISNSRIGNIILDRARSSRITILNSRVTSSTMHIYKSRVYMKDVRIGTLTFDATYSSIALVNTEINELRASRINNVLTKSNAILINCTINKISFESSFAALQSSKVILDNCSIGEVHIRTYGHGMDHTYLLIVNSRMSKVSINTKSQLTGRLKVYIANSSISDISVHTGAGLVHYLDASITSSVISKLVVSSDDNTYSEDSNISLINVTGNTLKLATEGFLRSKIVVKYSNIVNGEGIYFNRVGENTLINITYSNIVNDKPYGLYIRKGYKYETSRILLNNNWWGDPSGPHHPKLNPGGKGCSIYVPAEGITLTNWLRRPSKPELKYPKVVASIEGSTEVSIGKEVVFDLSKSVDPDGKVVKYIALIPSEQSIIITNSPKIKVKFTAAGLHNIVFYVIDNEGLIARKSIKVNVIKYPVIIIYSPKEGFVTSRGKVCLKLGVRYYEEVSRVRIYLNSTCVATLSPKPMYDLVLNIGKEGRYVIRVVAETATSKTVEKDVLIIYDRTPPRMHLSVRTLPGNVVVIEWSTKDCLSGLEKTLLTLNSKIISRKPSGSLKLRLKPGTYEIWLSAKDRAGNTADLMRRVVIVKAATTTATKVVSKAATTPKTKATATKATPATTTTTTSTRKVSTATTATVIKTSTSATTSTPSSSTSPVTTKQVATSKPPTKASTSKQFSTLLVGGAIVVAVVIAVMVLLLKRR